jgi:hypothetical protein
MSGADALTLVGILFGLWACLFWIIGGTFLGIEAYDRRGIAGAISGPAVATGAAAAIYKTIDPSNPLNLTLGKPGVVILWITIAATLYFAFLGFLTLIDSQEMLEDIKERLDLEDMRLDLEDIKERLD